VFDWPSDGRLEVALPNASIAEAYVLADKKKESLPVVCDDDKVVVSLPGEAPDAIDSVIVLVKNDE
jgi:CBS domain-containing protein